jgi:hypothetical protein
MLTHGVMVRITSNIGSDGGRQGEVSCMHFYALLRYWKNHLENATENIPVNATAQTLDSVNGLNQKGNFSALSGNLTP